MPNPLLLKSMEDPSLQLLRIPQDWKFAVDTYTFAPVPIHSRL